MDIDWNALLPWILVGCAAFALQVLVFWLIIFSAVKSALRVDRERAEDERAQQRVPY